MYSFFVSLYLCFGPIYFDIHFNVGKYNTDVLLWSYTRNTRGNWIKFLGQLFLVGAFSFKEKSPTITVTSFFRQTT